jgi:hypothetical protein
LPRNNLVDFLTIDFEHFFHHKKVMSCAFRTITWCYFMQKKIKKLKSELYLLFSVFFIKLNFSQNMCNVTMLLHINIYLYTVQ